MTHHSETAWAKLNLTLDILGKRPDGYHDMRMVMQSVSLCDQITIAPGGDFITSTSNLHFLPSGDKNLAVIAAHRFYEALEKPAPGLSIHIEKSIPVCAGLAGGSSDAAAVLRGLNTMEGAPFTTRQLEKIGEQVGSDVPYCVGGGTALAEGRGEILSPLPSLPPCWIVVCKPDFPVSTPELFGRIDSTKIRNHPDTTGMIAALEARDLEGVAHRLYNVFEDALHPRQGHQVAEIKNTLIQSGAIGATMSGSGPTAFGIYHSQEIARQGYDLLAPRYQETFITQVV